MPTWRETALGLFLGAIVFVVIMILLQCDASLKQPLLPNVNIQSPATMLRLGLPPIILSLLSIACYLADISLSLKQQK